MSKIKEHFHEQIEAGQRAANEKPILFSTSMVQAILEGRKTQTRRVIKPQPGPELKFFGWQVPEYTHVAFGNNFRIESKHRNPYGQSGDLLWVRETTIRNNNSNTYWPVADGYVKTADYEKTIPSIHMPKAAARIWLQVKDVKVERVNDISEKDIIAEGVRIPVNGPNNVVFVLGEENSAISFLPERKEGEKYTQFQLLKAFWAELWCKVNSRKSWDANPWVWVVEFEVVSTSGRPEFCSCEMPAKMHGQNKCWRCKKQLAL